jgi:hypothetical protein
MRRVAMLVFGASLAVTAPALAAPVSAHSTAVRHFEAGRKLVESGKPDQAIREFRMSLDAEATVGAWLNFGECHEALQQWQEAYEAYRSAQALAAQLRDDRLSHARDSADRVLSKAVRLTIPTSPDPDTKLEIDGVLVPRERWSAILLSPDAAHKIVVRGSAGEMLRDVQGHAGENVPLTIELVVPAQPKASPSNDKPPPADHDKSQRTIGYIVGGAGLAIAAVGGIFGLRALGQRSDLEDATNNSAHCKGEYPNAICTDEARRDLQPLEDSGKRNALVANVLLVTGAVALVTGITLVLLAPSRSTTTTTAKIGLGVRTLLVGGTF